MGRCFGITKNLHRCSRIGEWKLFCLEHRRQPIAWFVFFVFTILAGLASMQSAWGPSNKSEPAKHARVLFVDKKLIFPEKGNDPVKISFGLMNAGNVDATVILKDRTYYFSTDPAQTVFKFQSSPTVEIPVSAIPNAIWRAEMRFDFRVTAEKMDALKSGKARLFFYAHGEYRDTFGEIYSLPFEEMYDPMFPGNLVSPPKDIVFE